MALLFYSFRLHYANSKEEGKLSYIEIFNFNRTTKHLVEYDDFGDLAFWKSLEINDQL